MKMSADNDKYPQTLPEWVDEMTVKSSSKFPPFKPTQEQVDRLAIETISTLFWTTKIMLVAILERALIILKNDNRSINQILRDYRKGSKNEDIL